MERTRAIFTRDAEAVRNQAGHHVHGIVVGHRDEIIHLRGTGLPPASDAHGIALDQARVYVPVGLADQGAVRLDGRDGVALMHQALGEIIADAPKPQNQDVVRFRRFTFLHGSSGFPPLASVDGTIPGANTVCPA
jgi:hypothetical protein